MAVRTAVKIDQSGSEFSDIPKIGCSLVASCEAPLNEHLFISPIDLTPAASTWTLHFIGTQSRVHFLN